MKKEYIAAILSLLRPGVGQVYCGRTTRGIAVFIGSLIITIFTAGFGSIIAWLVAAWDAYQVALGKEFRV